MTTFALHDGRSFVWQEAGAGPPLVLLHGWAMSSAVFAGVGAALGDSWRVLAPDLRGHGVSSPGASYDLDAFCADLSEWFEALQLHQVALLGWSLGGMVALRLATQLKHRIDRLVLVSTSPRFVTGADWVAGLPDGQVRILARSFQRQQERAWNDFFQQQFVQDETTPAQIEAWAAQVVRPDPGAALGGLATLQCVDLRQELTGIEQRALIIHGADDPIIPVGAGQYLAAVLPHSEMLEIPATGHVPFLSRPELCQGRIREFLA